LCCPLKEGAALNAAHGADSDLARLIEVWDQLPTSMRVGIMAMIGTIGQF